MSAMSDYLESGVINYLFRGQPFSPPSNISIALTSGVPVDSDTGATIPELPTQINGSGTGYNRINYATPSSNGSTKFNYVHGSGYIANSEQIVFNTALIDWGVVSGIAIVDSPTVGTGRLLLYTESEKPRTVFAGDAPKFDATKFQIEIS